MYTFILFVIFLIYASMQNNRLDALEAFMKKFEANTPVKKPDTTTQTTANPAQDSSVISSNIANPVPIKSISKHSEVSGEEMSGRILGRIGITALVIGMAFFLKYAYDNNWIQPAGRVLIGILIGLIIMAIGQYLRKKYLQYSDLLIGGGLAILYTSVLSSHVLYNLTDPIQTFMGLLVVTIIGVALSMMNATITLAVVAFIGGYLAPMFIGVSNLGTNLTFVYITILNAGILAILLTKKWTNLVLCALIGTWIIFSGWYFGSYTQELLIPTLLFVLVQFLIFTASSVFRIIVEKIKAVEIDYFVLSTSALSFFLLYYSLLMPEYVHYVSLGSVLIAGLYILIALVAYKENPGDRTLNIFLPGLAVAFLTIAVPIEFSGPWIAAWWFIESLVLYILASTSSSRGFQVMGVVVYILGLFNLFYYLSTYIQTKDFVILFNGPFIMTMFAVVTAYAIAFIYYRYGSVDTDTQKRGITVFVVIANILTLYAFTSQITSYYELQIATGVSVSQVLNWSNTSVSIFWAIYATLLTIIGFAKRFAAPRYMGLTLFIITAFKVVVNIWSLGELYRIVSFIVFGIIALSASFIYVKYRHILTGDAKPE
jgi:uncharacterized membrane protein